MISFHLRQVAAGGYVGFLSWPRASGYAYDYHGGEFPLAKTWQKVTLGYRINRWVAVWVDDTLVRYEAADVVHEDPSGDVIEVGKVSRNADTTPSGSILLDDVTFEVPRVDDLWVHASAGSDASDGRSPTTALATVQKAASLAGAGTVVHVMPGVYRESLRPALSGSPSEPTRYVAEAGLGTAVLRGSESSASLAWRPVRPGEFAGSRVRADALYVTDLSAWQLTSAPRFIVQLAPDGTVLRRLPLARQPDWSVATEWKYHAFWWAATGGSAAAQCDPSLAGQQDCDRPWRSMTELTDDADDREPPGIEPGNLTSLGDLTGATIVVVDTQQGHYTDRRKIAAHDVASGRVTVDCICEHGTGTGIPALGWGSKYYVENHPALLDTPGEWWYDPEKKLLYLWPPEPVDPARLSLEISRHEHGFNLKNRSNVTVDGLVIELYNGAAVFQRNWPSERSYGNTVRNATLRHVNWGLYLEQAIQATQSPANITDGFVLEHSEVGPMDTMAIRLTDWWENEAAAKSYSRSGITNGTSSSSAAFSSGLARRRLTAAGRRSAASRRTARSLVISSWPTPSSAIPMAGPASPRSAGAGRAAARAQSVAWPGSACTSITPVVCTPTATGLQQCLHWLHGLWDVARWRTCLLQQCRRKLTLWGYAIGWPARHPRERRYSGRQ